MAKDVYRKFKNCIFCSIALKRAESEYKLTREHMFGRSISNYLPGTDNWFAINDTFELGVVVKRGSSQPKYFTSHSVCKKCNTTWMGEDMEKIIPIVVNMISGKRFDLSQNDLHILKRYLERLAAIVDVESSNLDLPANKLASIEYIAQHGQSNQYPPILSSTDRRAYKDGAPLRNVNLRVGYHKGILGEAFEQNLVPCIYGIQLVGKRFVFVMGKLAASIEIGRTEPRQYPNFVDLKGYDESDLAWPIHPSVSYDDYFSLYVQSPRIARLRKMFRGRRERRRYEKEWRSSRRIR